MLDLDSLKIFIRAAEVGSLSKVAEQQNMAIAAVSRRMSLLEAEFGVALLLRTSRGVQLTAAGKMLLPRAKEIMQLEAQARADLSDFGKGLRGAVGVMASTSAITQYLPRDLADFSKSFPDLRLDVREAYTSEIVAAVRDGSVEVGVVMAGSSVLDLNTTPYRADQIVIVAPRHFWPDVNSVRLVDVVDQDLVVMEDSTAMTRLLAFEARKAGIALRLRTKVGSFDAVCRMVEAGFGLGVQPRMAAMQFVETMGLRLIELDEDWAARQMLICTNPRIGISTAAKQLVAHLSACADSAQPQDAHGTLDHRLVDH
jgi:DNA-binding transcriptional LysR family regulator